MGFNQMITDKELNAIVDNYCRQIRKICDEAIYAKNDEVLKKVAKISKIAARIDEIKNLQKARKTTGEEWEIYKPAEPLIEDEKIRKALRAVYDAAPYRDNVVFFDGRWTFRGDKFGVMFDDREIKIEGWTEGKAYHIEELCGEEEE